MTPAEDKLTLDKPALYQIKVPGELDSEWADKVEGMALKVDMDEDGQSFTTLTGTFDQAGLHGLLRWLYALGLPLVSVVCLECGVRNGS